MEGLPIALCGSGTIMSAMTREHGGGAMGSLLRR